MKRTLPMSDVSLTSYSLDKLSHHQHKQLVEYNRLLQEHNRGVNLVSRATADQSWERHIRHCLAFIAQRFPVGANVVDYGAGGGLPGLVLAIAFPDTRFYLVDAALKKVRAVEEMAQQLGLENVEVHHARAEKWKGPEEGATYAVSRATAPLWTLWRWFEPIRVAAEAEVGCWTPGLLALKGGDLRAEIADLTSRRPALSVESKAIADLLPGWTDRTKVLLSVGDR